MDHGWIRAEDRSRAMARLSLLLAVVCLLILGTQTLGGVRSTPITHVLGFNIPLLLILPLALRRWPDAAWPAWLFCLTAFAMLAFGSFFAGGLNASVLVALPVLPLLVTAFLGARAGSVFAVLTGLLLAVYAVLHWQAYSFPVREMTAQVESMQRAVIYGLVLLVVVTALRILDSRLRAIRSRLEVQARRDPLTTLMNRRVFDDDLSQLAASAGLGRSAWLLMLIDVDYFKRMNDTFGHVQGDQVLIAIANTLREFAGAAGARVYRIAGDEFAVLVRAGNRERGLNLAQGLRRAVERQWGEGPQATRLSVTIGTAYRPGGSMDIVTTTPWLEAADQALYAAKAAGRNTVVMHQPQAG